MNPKIYQNNQGTWNVADDFGKYYGSFCDFASAKAFVEAHLNSINSYGPAKKPPQTKTVYVIEDADEGRASLYWGKAAWYYQIRYGTEQVECFDSKMQAESAAFQLTAKEPYFAGRLSIKEHVITL